MPGLARSPPQLPEWWPALPEIDLQVKVEHGPGPSENGGGVRIDPWAVRGKKDISGLQGFSFLLAQILCRSRANRISSPVSIKHNHIETQGIPFSLSTHSRAIRLMACWPLLSAAFPGRTNEPGPVSGSVLPGQGQGIQALPATWSAMAGTVSPWPYISTVGRSLFSMRRAMTKGALMSLSEFSATVRQVKIPFRSSHGNHPWSLR